MQLPPRPLLPLFLLFPVTCAPEQVCEPEPAVASVVPIEAPTAAEEPAVKTPEAAAVEVDERPPIALAKWREIKQAGEAAVKLPELDARIDQCRAFARRHPEHQTNALVLEALADALIEKGGYDPQEVAGHLAALAKLRPKSNAPTEIVGRYHLLHALPGAAGLALLELARERLAQDERELALLDHEQWRESRGRWIAYERTRTFVAEARLHLREGATDQALRAVERGHAETDRFVKDIALVDAAGERRGSLAAGVAEDLHVLEAELRHRKGDDAGARAALKRALGVVADVELRATYERLRGELGVGGDDLVVTAGAQPAQDFALKRLDGETVRLRDYRGKVVLVTFFATWCGPCKREMPLLQKFQEEHREKGVEVLAISIDDFHSRSKLAPFMKQHQLDLPVLLDEPEQLTEYNYRGVPALYVIDREGNVAHARTGYDPQLEEKLEHEIKAIVEREGDGGRKLLTVEQAPAGWGVRWQRPIRGELEAVAIAAPLGSAGGEVAAVGREGLMRWSASGEALPSRALTGYANSLDTADLDGDGRREWIVSGWSELKVLDQTGELFWEHSGKSFLRYAGHRDLDRDGFQELLLQDGDRVVAMKAVPEPMWTSPPFKELSAVQLDPAGAVMVHTDDKLVQIGARGEVTDRGVAVPKGRTLAGRLAVGDETIDLFKGDWDPAPRLDQDFDGDGRADVLVANKAGVVVYDPEGRPLLRVRSHDVDVKAAIGDLDGRPGAEVVLFVAHYGIVVLGVQG